MVSFEYIRQIIIKCVPTTKSSKTLIQHSQSYVLTNEFYQSCSTFLPNIICICPTDDRKKS